MSDLEGAFVCEACGARGADVRPDWDRTPGRARGQARRAGRRSHTAGSGGLRQAFRFFISSNSFRSHLRTASIRSTSVGAAGRLFACHAISATTLRLSTRSSYLSSTAAQRARIHLTLPCFLRYQACGARDARPDLIGTFTRRLAQPVEIAPACSSCCPKRILYSSSRRPTLLTPSHGRPASNPPGFEVAHRF